MDFVVDIGNSRVKWAWVEDGKISGDVTATELPTGRIDAYTKKHWGDQQAPSRVLVSNVGQAKLAEKIINWMDRRWKVTAQLLRSPEQGFGVANAYAEPERLGADRWAALVAARQATRKPACIIDCGTAITIDALGADGCHKGGLIIPGLALMRQSLVNKAPGVHIDEGAKFESASLLARDTNGAVAGGTFYTMVAVIDRVVADVSSELGASTQRFITGGDAASVLSLLAAKYQYREHLVLEGLAFMVNNSS